jgi:diguanylate cyclase (GGDEF)-like protein/PAS domain S-box-containing protein
VDDEVDVGGQVARILEVGLGCQVQWVASGEAALAQLDIAPVDLIITDMRMPGRHGLDLVNDFRRVLPSASVVVITGFAIDFPYVEVTQAGAEDILNKPFLAAELQAKVIRILEARFERHQRKLAESKYRNLFELSMDGMLLVSNPAHTIIDANQAIRDLTGRAQDELLGADILDLLDPADQGRFSVWLEFCQHSGKGVLGDLTMTHKTGSQLGVDVAATFIHVESDSVLFLSCKDVTEKREVSKRLADAAQRDELTGLYNKRSFKTRFENAIAHASDGRVTALSLMLLDLDNFKRCNDTHGHQAGDAVLKLVGKAIDASIRHAGGDVGFRFGGDEFAVVLEGAQAPEAVLVAERIRDQFASAETYGVTMSIGIAQYVQDMESAELVRIADEALYHAKGQGKNTVHTAGA